MSDASSDRPIDAPRCPLCRDANDCAPAREGRFDVPCWCSALPREQVSADALAQVPASQRGRACLCRACLTGARDAAAQRGT